MTDFLAISDHFLKNFLFLIFFWGGDNFFPPPLLHDDWGDEGDEGDGGVQRRGRMRRRCHHNGTTNKQGKVGLLSQLTMDG